MITEENTIYERGNIYRSRLVEVKPHIGRRRPIVTIPKELTEARRMGNLEQTEEEKDFVSKNVTSGRITLMPDQEKELLQIETYARNLCRRSLLVQDYMLHEQYLSVSEAFKEARGKYFQKRDEIAFIWDEQIAEFSSGLLSFISSCGIPHDEVVAWHQQLMGQLPNLEQWRKSFSFWLEAREFPSQPGALPGMDESWRKHTEQLAKALISGQISDLFEQSAKILKKIAKRDIIAKQAGKLIATANCILNNGMIQEKKMLEVAQNYAQLYKIDPDTNCDEFADELECCMGHALKLASQYNISLNLSLMPSSVDEQYLICRVS